MPKLVNYAARFDFARQAAFAVVRDRGPAALSRHSVADVLGTSVNTVRRLVAVEADLRSLAADEVARRRSLGRWGGPAPDVAPLAAALHLLRGVMPDEPARVAEELVWLRLVFDTRLLPAIDGDTVEALRASFQVAEHGYADDLPRRDGDSGPESAAEVDPIADQRDVHEANLDHRVTRALELLEVDDVDTEAVRLRAVIEGLVLGVCLGRLSPAAAVDALEHHLRALGSPD